MVIASTDIVFRLSGGSGNSNVNLSLGGVKSSVALVDNTLDNLFADSLGTESAAGSTKYRELYVHNNHGTLTMLNSRIYITANTPSTDDTVSIAIGTAAINGTEQTITDENTAPTGVTWSTTAVDYSTGLALGDIPPGQHKAVWYRRVINASAAAYTSNSVVFECAADSAA